MEMQVRGWREERTTWTTDTTGRTVPITTGLTKDSRGRLAAVIAIGADGPSAILSGNGVNEDITELLQALDDAEQAGR